MGSTDPTLAGIEGGHAQTASESQREAFEHLAQLRDRHRARPAEARTLPAPRLRRTGRWFACEAERLLVLHERVARAWATPSRPLGAVRFRLRMWRTDVIAPGVVVSALVFAVVAVWRFDVWRPVKGPIPDAIVAALFGTTLLALIAAVWSNHVRSPLVAWRIERRIKRHPESVLPTTARRRQAQLVARDEQLPVVPRRELYDEVLPGILDRERKDVQMIVGGAGAGKTTALTELARLLANVGVLPIVVEVWGERSLEVEKAARDRLATHAGDIVGSSAQLETLWQWLRARRRLVVLADDIDRIAPDGERGFVLRRTLEEVAGKDLPTVVTARPAGLPAGLAATAINLDSLDEQEAVEHVLRVAREQIGAVRHGSRAAQVRGDVEQWVREGDFAEVPFYLELLAWLVAVGRCPELPPARAVIRGLSGGRDQRIRSRIWVKADERYEWNPLWVRFQLLDHFYEEVAAGRVHRWLGIDRVERGSCLRALSGAALATLAATAVRAHLRATGEDLKKLRRWNVEEFLNPDDRDPDVFEDSDERRDVSTHELVDTGERLRILDRDPTGRLHFRHRIMQAYLASCSLVQQDLEMLKQHHDKSKQDGYDWCHSPLDWIGALLDPHHPERLTAHMTLIFAALHASKDQDNGGCKDLPKLILERLINEAARTHKPSGDADQRKSLLEPLKQLDPEKRADPDETLAKLATAAEIARATGLADKVEDAVGERTFAQDIIAKVRNAPGTTRWAKLSVIPSIAAIDSDCARGADDYRWDCLWEFAADPDPEIRRAASEAIEDDAIVAYRALEREIRRLIILGALRSKQGLPLDPDAITTESGKAPEYKGASDYHSQLELKQDLLRLRALGWVLPAIVSGLSEHPQRPQAGDNSNSAEPHSERMGDRSDNRRMAPAESEKYAAYVSSARIALEQLATLAFQSEHHELEGALANGFKHDAMRHASDPERPSGPGLVAANRRLVTDLCLDNASYWHARLALHQALALYTIAGSSERVAFDTYGRLFHRQGEPHPFVRRAAYLARRAVARHVIGIEQWDSLIWADETAIAGRRPTRLSATAAQLVGDITLLLNLKDRAPAELKPRLGEMRALPHCLSESRDRLEILGAGCASTCRYDLCPLTAAPVDEPNAQRGVSRAFCRAEQQIARRHKPPWQPHIRKRALRDFWREMERRART